MNANEILNLIRKDRKSRESAIRYLYDNPQLRNGLKKVLKSNGEDEHFKDVLNLTLVQFMKTVLKNRDFEVSTNLHSYLFVIARNIAIQKSKKTVQARALNIEDEVIKDDSVAIDLKIINEDLHRNLKLLLEEMGRNCYEILWSWAAGYKMKEIAEKLGYNSPEVVRRKKFTCLQNLSKIINENPNIKKLYK